MARSTDRSPGSMDVPAKRQRSPESLDVPEGIPKRQCAGGSSAANLAPTIVGNNDNLPEKKLTRVVHSGANLAPTITKTGVDERGWKVLDIGASRRPCIFHVKIGAKHLKLVSQEQPMHVYVNPDTEGLDEWEIPAGSGQVMCVGSPLEETAANASTAMPQDKARMDS